MTKYQHEFWDSIADTFNPLLTLLLLSVIFFVARRDSSFQPWPFLGRVLLALLVTYVIAHVNRWFDLWPAHPKFPSGHVTYAACVLTSMSLLNLRWLLLVPLLFVYSALIVALGFHLWMDIFAAMIFAPPVALLCHRAKLFRPRDEISLARK